MGISYNPRTITDGLVLALDAGNTKGYDNDENLLTYSNDFSQGVWAGYCGDKSNITYNTTEVTDPFGTFTSIKIARNSVVTCTGAGGEQSWGVLWNGSTIVNTANTYTISLYVRGSVAGDTVQFGFNDSQTSTYTLTTSWQRITYTGIPNSISRGIQITINGISKNYYILGAQVETGSSASPYTPTTTTAKTRGTTLTDLSGRGNNGTLINGVGYNSGNLGSLVLDGTDDYINFSSFVNPYSETVIVWARSATELWDETGWISSSRAQNGHIIHPNAGTKSISFYVIPEIVTYPFILSITPNDITIPHMYCYTTNGSNLHQVYFDGSFMGQSTTNITRTLTPSPQRYDVGFDNAGARYGNGNIYSVMRYNRALTAAEISQNYNALKSRYI